MNPAEIKAIESRRQALLGQLAAAETALRNGYIHRVLAATPARI
jgi:hypothetical protein